MRGLFPVMCDIRFLFPVICDLQICFPVICDGTPQYPLLQGKKCFPYPNRETYREPINDFPWEIAT